MNIWTAIIKNFLGFFIFLWSAYNLLLYAHYHNTKAGFLFGILFVFAILAFLFLYKKIKFFNFYKLRFKIVLNSYIIFILFFIVIFLWVNFSFFLFFPKISFMNLFYEINIIFNILLILSFYLFFSFFSAGLGRKILKLFTKKNEFKDNFFISIAIGLFPLMISSLFISFFKIAYPITFLILISLLFFFSLVDIKFFLKIISTYKFKLIVKNKKTFAKFIILTTIFIFFAITFANNIKPMPGNDDVDSLHSYYNTPNLISQYHQYVTLPFIKTANMGQNTEMIYLPIISLIGAKYIAHFSLLFFFFFLVISYKISVKIFNESHAILSLLSLFFIPWNFYFLNSNKTDIFLCFYLILLLYIFIKWNSGQNKIYLYLIGVFSGISLGIKYNSVLFLLPLYLIIFYILLKNKRKIFIKQFLLSAFLCIIFFSPWLAKNIYFWHDPIYPYLSNNPDSKIVNVCSKNFQNQRMKEVSLIKWSNEDDNPIKIVNSIWKQSVGKDYTNYNFFNFGFFAFILLPFYFFKNQNKKIHSLLFLILFFFVFYFITPTKGRIWYGMFGINLLYLILPSLLLKFRSLLYLFFIFVVMTIFHNFNFLNYNIAYASGALTQEEFLLKTNPIYTVSDKANQLNLSEENKILMPLDFRVAYIKNNDKSVIVDNYFARSGCYLDDGKNFYKFLKQNKIHYIIYSKARESYVENWRKKSNKEYEESEPSIYYNIDKFNDFIVTNTDEEFNYFGYKIFKIKQ